MRFKKLDLNLLVALDHMLSLRSVSAAAGKMHMSQSAMSNALTRLRDYFNDPLLVKVGRRMELTPRAEAIRAPVRDIMVRLEATIDTVPSFDPAESDREFTILLSDYTMAVLMPQVLALAQKEAGRVRFRLLSQTAEPYLLLERGEADLLIVPQQFCSADHPVTELFRDEYVCLTWKDGIYGKGSLSAADYRAAGHAVMVPPNSAGSLEALMLAELGVERRVEVTTFAFSALPQLIVGTNRIATVHKRIADQALTHLPLVCHSLPFAAAPLVQVMQWHSYRSHDPGLQWLGGVFRRAAEQF